MLNTIITLPLFQQYGKKTKFPYSLNKFLMRLVHSQPQTREFFPMKAKKDLVEHVRREIKRLEPEPVTQFPVHVILEIYREDDRARDIGNYGILEKFTTDVVVKAGILKDDSHKYITAVHIIDAGVDRENPRGEYRLSLTEPGTKSCDD